MLTRVENLWQEKSRRIPRRYWSKSMSVSRREPRWYELKPPRKTIANLLCGVNLHRGFESPPLRQVVQPKERGHRCRVAGRPPTAIAFEAALGVEPSGADP